MVETALAADLVNKVKADSKVGNFVFGDSIFQPTCHAIRSNKTDSIITGRSLAINPLTSSKAESDEA